MKLSAFISAAFSIAVIFLSTGANAAGATTFNGSRAEVRTICTGDGMVLVEGLSWSYCTSVHNEASVTCRDDGVCAGTGPQVASFDDLRRYGSPHEVIPAIYSVPVGMPDSFATYN